MGLSIVQRFFILFVGLFRGGVILLISIPIIWYTVEFIRHVLSFVHIITILI